MSKKDFGAQSWNTHRLKAYLLFMEDQALQLMITTQQTQRLHTQEKLETGGFFFPENR
jgi:hypothetical protein